MVSHKKIKHILIDNIYAVFRRGISRVSPVTASKILYLLRFHKCIDLDNPRDFNEKIMWLKLFNYSHNPKVSRCADKLRVRDYVKEKGQSHILNRLIGVYDTVDDIDWDGLPDAFAIKCNHGCGYNIICENKKNLDIELAKRKLKKWLKEDYWTEYAELNYKNIRKQIICESYIASPSGGAPNDYKVYCFNGSPDVILVCYNRNVNLSLVWMDKDWNITQIGSDKYFDGTLVNKPRKLNDMIESAKILSEGFPFVRVDFYETEEKIVFGEMTFTPAAGLANYYSQHGLEYLGSKLNIKTGDL